METNATPNSDTEPPEGREVAGTTDEKVQLLPIVRPLPVVPPSNLDDIAASGRTPF